MRILLVLLCAAALFAADNTVVTIYSDGYAVVRESRSFNLTAGDNTVTVADLPRKVMGESIGIYGPNFVVRNFEYKAAGRPDYSLDQLLELARGKEVGFRVDSQTTARGVLLEAEYDPGNVYLLKSDKTLQVYPRIGLREWTFYSPVVQDDRLAPEFSCNIHSESAGARDVELVYEVADMHWDARYKLLVEEDSSGILEAWAGILNRSGKTYENASITLAEGNYGRYRAQDISQRPEMKLARTSRFDLASATRPISEDVTSAAVEVEASRQVGFTSERLFQVNLYELPYASTLKDSAKIDVLLTDRAEVRAYLKYGFEAASEYDASGRPRTELIVIANSAEDKTVSLPAGKLDIYRQNKSGLEQFVGSHRIMQKATNDTVQIRLPEDADIWCTSRTLRKSGSGNKKDLDFEYTVKNSKSVPVLVTCNEKFWGNVEIEKSTVEARVILNSPEPPFSRIEFDLLVPPGSVVTGHFEVELRAP